MIKSVSIITNDSYCKAFNTTEEIDRLVTQFESCILPCEEWNHRAHLTVAVWYLVHYPKTQATSLVRESIQKYNQACGIIQTKDSGYHETITLFYMWLVSKYLLSNNHKSIINCLNGLLRAYGDKRLPLEYYSKQRLMSAEARAGWVEPDLMPLD